MDARRQPAHPPRAPGELEAKAACLERAREEEARRAVAREQARIARELHGVISHNVSVMVVAARR